METALTLVAGGGTGSLGMLIIQWRKDRHAEKAAERTADVQIEGQRDGLTLDLLRAAREEMSELRKEMGDQRSLAAKAAHIEEALDHIQALLDANGEIEFAAARKRASAFLKRMRPDPVAVRAEERNELQRAISKKNIKRDFGIEEPEG